VNGLLNDLVSASLRRDLEDPELPAATGNRRSLLEALRGRQQLSLLAEFKRSSPSDPCFDASVQLVEQLQRYEQAGAAGISVLTEPTRFGGCLADLRTAVASSELPMLRKDFLVRPGQVRESQAHGATAVLLIVRCLPGNQLQELVSACRDVSLEMLIECHDEQDLDRALPYGDAMIGINNRNLDTLCIDRDVFTRLAQSVPAGRVVVAESGYAEPCHLDAIVGLADAVLIGSALMRGGDAAAFQQHARAIGDPS
jgi:indole-3-glycerol phosphate synthase